MKIYNAFGIKPTNTYVSAGSDYYIPNIIEDNKEELALKAFEKSYGKTKNEITNKHGRYEENSTFTSFYRFTFKCAADD